VPLIPSDISYFGSHEPYTQCMRTKAVRFGQNNGKREFYHNDVRALPRNFRTKPVSTYTESTLLMRILD